MTKITIVLRNGEMIVDLDAFTRQRSKTQFKQLLKEIKKSCTPTEVLEGVLCYLRQEQVHLDAIIAEDKYDTAAKKQQKRINEFIAIVAERSKG